MLHCIEVIKHKLPKVFILENVKNFKFIQNGEVYNYLLNKLESIGEYNIYPEILNTKDYGIPQNRERLFIIGIRRGHQKKEYKTPETIRMIPPDKFILDKTILSFDKTKLSTTLLLKINKVNNNKGFFIEETGFPRKPVKILPTINTISRIYSTTYNRKLSNQELLLLQGFRQDFIQVVSTTQLKKQIGNSMSVNVLIALFNVIFDK